MEPYRKYELWNNVTEEQWKDWKWQLAHGITQLVDLAKVCNFTAKEYEAIKKVLCSYRMKISPHLALRMAENKNNSIGESLRKQFIPSSLELRQDRRLFDDVNADTDYMPVKGLVHRYPTKVLIFPSNSCGSFCRYCFRKKYVGECDTCLLLKDYKPIFDYLKNNSQINEVIFSGGDPLTVDDGIIEYVLHGLSKIESVKIVRFHTRMPISIPYRITDGFVEMIDQYFDRFAIYFVLHIDSENELSNEALRAIRKLTRRGIMCLASCPLLKGVNDSEKVLENLWNKLVENRVKPYYLFHTDPIQGISHFVVPLSRGMEIMKNIYDNISGLAVPLYCFNIPGGGGHILISSNNIQKIGKRKYKLENFEGKITEYEEPIDE